MHEKKQRLMEAGMSLFNKHGYHQTSIQDIATEAGVSKGSFYSYFDSKEEFITTSIKHFYQQMTEAITSINNRETNARDSFEKQITTFIHYIYEYKDFIAMHLRENIPITEESDRLVEQIKISTFQNYRNNILAIYGERAEPFIIDLVIQVDGLIGSYSKWIVSEDMEITLEQIGPFILRRLDDIVEGMQKTETEPLTVLPASFYETENSTKPQQILDEMRREVRQMKRPDEEKLLEIITMMEEALAEPKKKAVLIQGLLVHFKGIKAVESQCEQLAKTLHIDLL